MSTLEPARVFISCDRADARLAGELRQHLSLLARLGVIEPLDAQAVLAGDALRERVLSWMDRATVIVLLVSVHYLSSDHCYEVECRRAMERHESGQARVIPVRLRGCDWGGAAFAELAAVPRDGRPVVAYRNRDRPWIEVVAATRSAVEALRSPRRPEPAPHGAGDSPPEQGLSGSGAPALHPPTRILFRESITDMTRKKVGDIHPTNPVAFARLQDGARLTVEAEHDSRVEGARVKRKAACRELLICVECALFIRFDRVRAVAMSGPAWMARLESHASGASFLVDLRSPGYPPLARMGQWLAGPQRLPDEVAEGLTRSLGIPPGLEPEITAAALLQAELASSADIPAAKLGWLEWVAKCLLDRRVHERAAGADIAPLAEEE